MTLSHGKTYYQPNGAKVVLDHVHKKTAFVYPLLITQTTSYHGDSFEENEHVADHLIALPVDHLSDKAPVAVLEERAKKLRGKIDALRTELENEKTAATAVRRELTDLIQQVKHWRRKNPCFDRITNLLNGEKIFALKVPSWKYRCTIPQIVDTDNAAALQLIHKGQGKFEWLGHWRQEHGRYGDTHMETVEFFDTETEMQAFIKSLWDVLLGHFNKTSEDVKFGYVWAQGKMIKYTTLAEWVKRFPFLSIPDYIETDKKAYEAKIKSDMLTAAKDRVAELEKS